MEWYEYQWERTQGVNIQDLFTDVPTAFQSDVMYHLNQDIINKVLSSSLDSGLTYFKLQRAQFNFSCSSLILSLSLQTSLFGSCSPAFKRSLSVIMKFIIYTANEYVVHRGDLGKEIFFVLHGRLDMFEDDIKRPVASYIDGSYYGKKEFLCQLFLPRLINYSPNPVFS